MADPQLTFAVLSDMHFMAWKETGAPVDWTPALEKVLSDVHAKGPDFVVINGDLTNGKERDYALALASLRRFCPRRAYFTMGNHEYYGFHEEEDFTPALAQARFCRHAGRQHPWYEQRVAGLSFLFLATERYAPDMNDAAWLSDVQLRWFADRLEAAPPGPVFAFLHQPVGGTVAGSEGSCFQSDELRAILRRRPGVIFCSGHTHCRMDRADQLVVQDGTLFVGGGCCYTGTPQSRWVELHADRVLLRLWDHTEDRWLEAYDCTWDRMTS